MKRYFVGYVAMLLVLANCASLSTMQTARVLEKGESEHALGLGFYNSDDFLGGDDISIPVLEYQYRRGIWNNFDAGIKLTNLGSLVLDGKYNLVNGQKWALATGLGLGYLDFESTVGNVTAKSTIIDVMLPLYLSYDVGVMTSFYGAAKYVLRSISTSGGTITGGGDGSLISGSLGLKVGKTSGALLEASLVSGLDNDFAGTQFNAGYFFSF